MTHKFEIAGHEGYITVGLYADGQPGEIFLKMAKEGSTISGLMDTLATSVSLALQYGVPLKDVVEQVRPRALRAERLHRQPARSRSRSRWWTTSSAGSARGSSPPRTRRPSASSTARRSWRTRPAPFGASALRPRPDEGITAQGEAVRAPAPGSAPAPAMDDAPKGSAAPAAAAAPATASIPVPVVKEELAVIATNSAVQRQRQRQRQQRPRSGSPRSLGGSLGGGSKVAFSTQADAPSCAECGSIMVRNGVLLQVPELREHLRLQLSPSPRPAAEAPERSGAS